MCCIIGSTIIGASLTMLSGVREKAADILGTNYYLHTKKVLHGLPVAVISSIALGYIFKTEVAVAATYGAINYSIVTFLLELHGPQENENELNSKEKLAAGLILFTSYALGTILVNAALKTNLTFFAAIPLACGAFVGQLARQLACESDTSYFNRRGLEASSFTC